MTPSCRRALPLACLALFLALAASLAAQPQRPIQVPRIIRPEQKETQSEVRISGRVLSGPEVEFGGYEEIPFTPNTNVPSTELGLGDEKSVNFDNGSIRRDFIAKTDDKGNVFLEVPKNPDGTESNETGNFSYGSDKQLVDADGNPVTKDNPTPPVAIDYDKYAATADGSVFEQGDSDLALGWEVQYLHTFRPKGNFGFLIAGGFSGFDTEYSTPLSGNLLIYRKRVALQGSTSPLQTDSTTLDADDNGIRDNYSGPRTGTETDFSKNDRLRVEFPTIDSADLDENGQLKLDGPNVTSGDEVEGLINPDTDLRTTVFTLRAGPTYRLELARRWRLSLSAGVAATAFNGTLRSSPSLNVEAAGDKIRGISPSTTPRLPANVTSETELGLGFYIDANAEYLVSDRVNVFSGVNYQTGQTHTLKSSESNIRSEIDLSQQIYVQTGFGFAF